MNLDKINRTAGILLIILSFMITIPLTIKTLRTGGGTWGFGVIGIPILLPLCTYSLFGVTGVLNQKVENQRIFFITSHLISIATGIVSFIYFPFLPWTILIVPLILAMVGILDKKNLKYHVLIMIVLPIVANLLLLKWELDFGRTWPVFQLFGVE